MIRKIAKLKYWEIAVTGILATTAAMLAVFFGGRWAVDTWPGAYDGIQIAYFISAAVVSWGVVGIFVEAALTRYRTSQVDGALDQLAEALGKALSAEERNRG